MREQRECGGCGGTGETMTDFRDGRYESSLACEVCAGRGSVDARASREDAVADAETLRDVADELRSRTWFGQRSLGLAAIHGHHAASSALAAHKHVGGAYWHGLAHKSACIAARAAFSAVPGLRG